jgi:hypothetical protein
VLTFVDQQKPVESTGKAGAVHVVLPNEISKSPHTKYLPDVFFSGVSAKDVRVFNSEPNRLISRVWF